MAAIGELIIYFIYFILGLSFVTFLILSLTSKKTKKPFMIISIFFGLLMIIFKSCQYKGYINDQKEQVGIYYLTKYPNCNSCYIELKEDMTYVIEKSGGIIKKGTWHHESGGDYWITYLDGENYQLGSGDFSYTDYKLKY